MDPSKQTAPESRTTVPQRTDLREQVKICFEINEAVVKILAMENKNPAWKEIGGERFAAYYPQERELSELLEKYMTVENFNSSALPHAVKLAIANVATNVNNPIGSLYALLAETALVVGIANGQST